MRIPIAALLVLVIALAAEDGSDAVPAVRAEARAIGYATPTDRMIALAMRLVAAEHAYPGFRPRDPDPMTQAVTVPVELIDGALRVAGPPRPAAGANFEIQLRVAFADTSVPDYWVVVTDADGRNARYWLPLRKAGILRMESLQGEPPLIAESREFLMTRGRLWIDLPFVPGGRIGFFTASGRPAGRTEDAFATLEERWPGNLAIPRGGRP